MFRASVRSHHRERGARMTLSYYVRPSGAPKDRDKTADKIRQVYEVQHLWVVGRTVRYTLLISGSYIFTVPLSDLKSATD